MSSPQTQSEPFPSYVPENEEEIQRPGNSTKDPSRRGSITSRLSKAPSSVRTRTRTGSLRQSFLESNPPLGMWQATGEIGSKIPTLPEIRNGAFAADGWNHEGQMEHRGTNPHEIHARRLARTSTASTRTRKSSVSANAPPVIAEERHEFFPKRTPTLMQELVEEVPTAQGLMHARAEEVQQPEISEKHAQAGQTSARESSTTPSRAASDPRAVPIQIGPDETGTYPNGYRFPKKHTWSQSTMIGLRSFWRFFCTPFGVIVTIYGLNVVGWGAMIFFVLLKAAPAMCHPNCDDNSSAREKWIEIDSQVLNGLFCVTAYGLFPWRARDFYYLMRWRVGGNQLFHRRLAGINRGWYRLPGSDKLEEHLGPPPVYTKNHPRTPEAPPPYTAEEIAELEKNPAIPVPATSMPEPPLTGIRAPPTKSVTIDFVVWMYMFNTMFQVLLCVWMWHWGRLTRPAWGTGVWITFGCIVAICAGVTVFMEGSKVKKVEGIPVQEYDVLESMEDYQERKAKDDAKEAKKLARHEHHHHFRHDDTHVVVRSEKLKGHQWFTRH